MKRLVITAGVIALALLADDANAVVTEDAINASYYKSDVAALEGLREELQTATPGDALLAGYLDWRLASLFVGNGDRKSADAALERGQETLEAIVAEAPDNAEAWALLSGVLGMRIGIQPMTRGLRYGGAASRAMNKALELEPGNPRVLLVDGIGKLNTPSMFGGSRKKAMQQFDAALAAIRANGPGRYSWGEADIHVWRGIAERNSGNSDAARTAFDRALELVPSYEWARYLRDRLDTV